MVLGESVLFLSHDIVQRPDHNCHLSMWFSAFDGNIPVLGLYAPINMLAKYSHEKLLQTFPLLSPRF